MADIVGERECFDEVLVQPQRAGERPRDRRDFERVREPRAVVVAARGEGLALVGRVEVTREDLCLVAQAAERGRMRDPVSVALERRPIRMLRFGLGSAGRVGRSHRVRGEQERFALGEVGHPFRSYKSNPPFKPLVNDPRLIHFAEQLPRRLE